MKEKEKERMSDPQFNNKLIERESKQGERDDTIINITINHIISERERARLVVQIKINQQ